MLPQGKEEEKMTKEEQKILEQISCILARENYITSEEQIRILELLRKEK